MDSSGEDGPRSEAARRQLANEYPDWLPGLSRKEGTVDALWFKVPGSVVLTDTSYAGLRQRIEVFLEVFGETHDRYAAEQAANDLET